MTTPTTAELHEAGLAEAVTRLSTASGFSDATLIADAPDAIRLLAGIPDEEALPIDAVARAYERVRANRSRAAGAFQYSNSQGIPELREWIAAREGVAPERILVTTGGAHGLSLAVQALIPQDSLVAVDNPIWPLFLRYLELKTTNILPIPLQHDGLDVDALEAELRAGKRISGLYTVPDFHNPTQGSLTIEKRQRIVELADHYGFWFIADNPYREIYFGEKPLSIEAFHESSNTVHVNTFSKTLGPGLRLGWIVLPERVTEGFVRLRNRNDSQTSTLTQTIIAELLNAEPNFFDENLGAARKRYRNRAETLVHALDEQLPGVFDAVVPEGGYFLWARLRDDAVDWRELYRAAVQHGVSYQPGAFFASAPGTDAERYLRFAYGDNSESRLEQAVSRLAIAFEGLTL